MADYSDLGAVPVAKGPAAHTDLGAVPVEKKTTYPYGNNAIEQAQDMIMVPATEIARGANKGAAAVAAPAAGVLKFVGLPDDMNFFLKAQISGEHAASKLPDTNPNKSLIISMANAPFELVGEAPGVISEFQQGGALAKMLKLGPGLSRLTGLAENNKAIQGAMQAAEFGLTKAMEGLKNGPGGALKEGAEAASVGLAFPVVGSIIKEVGGRYGKTMVKNVLTVLTGDPKLAEEITLNPSKYTLNPMKSVPDPAKVLEEGKAKIDVFKKSNADEHMVQSEILNEQLNTLRASQTDARAALADASSKGISEIKAASEKALQNVEESSIISLTTHTDNVVKAVSEMRKQKGEAVGNAVSDIIEKNPMASVPYKTVGRRFENTVREAAKSGKVPFNVGTEEISAKTVAADAGEIKKFNEIWQEFTSRKKAGELSVSYLQTLKGALGDMADASFRSGRNQLGKLYSDLSKVVNPAKLTEKVPGLMEEEGNIVMGLAKKYPELANANKEYAAFKPKHDEIIALTAKKDANGALVPDINKVVNAVERGDVATINRIWKAEKDLPKELQMLPKVKEAVAAKNKMQDEALATLKLAQRKAQQTKLKLASEQKQILNYQLADRRRQLFDLNKKAQETNDKMVRELAERVDFLERQKSARFSGALPVKMHGMVPHIDIRPVTTPLAAAGAKLALGAEKAIKGTAEKVGGALEGNLMRKAEGISVGPESGVVAEKIGKNFKNQKGFVDLSRKAKDVTGRPGTKMSKEEIRAQYKKIKELRRRG